MGRRARKDPEQEALFDRPGSSEPRRRPTFSDPDPISPAPPADAAAPTRRSAGDRSDRRARAERARAPQRSGGRAAAAAFPVRRQAGLQRPVSAPPSDEPRRRSTFGDRSSPGVPEETRRRSPFGLRPSLGAPVPPPRSRRRGVAHRSATGPCPASRSPRRSRSPGGVRRPARPPPARAASPVALRPGTPSRPSALKPPLNAEPEPIGPARPLRGAGLALGSVMGGGAPAGRRLPVLPIPSGPPAPVRPHSPAGPPPGPPPPAAAHGPARAAVWPPACRRSAAPVPRCAASCASSNGFACGR